MNTQAHFGFILAAYIAGAVILAAMIFLTVADYATLKKKLVRLSARAGAEADRDG